LRERIFFGLDEEHWDLARGGLSHTRERPRSQLLIAAGSKADDDIAALEVELRRQCVLRAININVCPN
jgi:hypothetical protein